VSASSGNASSLSEGVGGNELNKVVASPSSRAHARGNRADDHLSEFFSGAPQVRGKRPGLFRPQWLDLTTGERRRATRLELREAYRLWAVHRDIRLGRLGTPRD
jgi:hypothetical protein